MIQILLLSNLNSIIKFIITLIHSIIFKSFKFFSIISIFSFFLIFIIIYSKKRKTKKRAEEQLDDSPANNQFYDQSREYRKPTVEPRTLSSNEERGQMEVGIPAQRGADSS